MGTQIPLSFTLGRNAVYKADEVVTKRKYKGQHDETLVKWVTITAFAPASESTDKAVRREEPKEYLVWMRNEEMRACCPHLISTNSPENRLGATGGSASRETGLESEDSMQEMADDVRSLVDRAKRIINGTPYGGKRSGKHLSNTITILGAYTKIPCLADTFRECGALDLLLSLLSSQDSDARKSSNDMLRSLAACDPASRAYVFLQLAKEDDAENNVGNASSPPENHQMLLDLFAETASSEELAPILSCVTFPQVPGRFLFSLLKKYLRVTSTVRKDPTDNNCPPPPSSLLSSSSFHSSSAKFEAFCHTFQLVTELFSIFSWYEVDLVEPILKGTSIFTGTTATDTAASALKKAKCAFKKRSDFQTEQEYALYVKDNMRPGMRVKAIVTYESVREGDRGEYRQTNNGTPPAQFAWDGLGGETYWVYWHQVELLPLEREQQEGDGDVMPHSSMRQPYILKALAKPLEKGVQQDHWWELLCLLKAVPSPHVQEICSLMGDHRIKCFDDLIDHLPSLDKVRGVLGYLDMYLPHLSQELLSFRRLAPLHNCSSAPAVSQNLSLTLPQATPTSYRTHPPYPDPYDVEPPLLVKKPPSGSHLTPPPAPSNDPLSYLQSLSSLQGFLRNRQEEVDPSAQLQVLQGRVESSSCSSAVLDDVKLTIESLLNKHSKNCHLALQSLLVIRAGAQSTGLGATLGVFSGKGFLSLVLRLMHQSPTSCSLQCIGLECLYLLVGGAMLDREFLQSGTKPTPPDPVGTVAMVTLHTIFCRGVESENVRAISQAVRCVLDNYNLQMSATQKKYCVTAVEHGLILLCLLSLKDDIAKAMKDWNIDWLLTAAQHRFPNFPAKMPLCHVLASGMGLLFSGGPSAEPVANDDEERLVDLSAKIVDHVTWVTGVLRNTRDLHNKNPLSRLLDLVYPDERDPFTHSGQLMCPPPLLSSLFLAQRGVYLLGRALEECHSQSLSESAAILLGCLVLAGREEAAQVVLQGGLRTLLECMRLQESNKQIQLLCCRVLDLIAKDSDNLAVMAAESVGVQVAATMDKFKDEEEICKICIHLIEICGSEMVARAELHTKILATIFSGVLKLTLDSIEDARRDGECVCIPKLAAFMQYMSTGSGGPLKSGNKESGFDKAEVSSNTFRLQKLFDADSSTYWESSGRSGTHWIRLHFHHGMVVKRLAIEVNANDSSYMPQKVTIQGGISPETVTDLCTVNIPATFTGYYDLLVSAKKHYPVVVIRVKRCHQGGIDTRIHGLICQCTRASLWPVFGDLLSARTKLFYYIQMHTWLADTSLQPLELFDRLNVIITHEQRFADSYLWTGLARRCLGQACRVSLITPLIEKLTQVGQNGAILGSMIQCYVSQIRAAMDPTWKLLLTSDPSEVDMSSDLEEEEDPNAAAAIHTQLVQCSRTRRLCRLLVECDSTASGIKLEGEEDDERVESGGTAGVGQGTVAISACWREVVLAELLRFLQRFECSTSPHAVATDLVCVYDRLKQAMVELFGGHSNFALGMKEGFTKAFQSLDEVTGVKFSESLCLCIEGLMDCVSKDSHPFYLNISESKREALLLHLAEPLQFMHSLDLAHIFEHYYRRHLSLRLLQGRSISVPLERRLAHAFAHCFPHKYPLQMLTDLEESSTMMDRFCDSELLESIDRLMAQAASPDLVTSEVMELAQKCSFYRQRKLQVFTLNPCYWSLRHRPLPSPSHLPKPLGSFCEDYERFFTTVRAYGLQQHERARKLHWTLHGWALLRYGRLSLAMTTTQMVVLLQFNQAQELSFKQLQESTQLSEAELCDALLALTSEHQDPLLLLQMSLTQTSSSSIDSNTSSVLEEEEVSLQGTPFKPNAILKLNEDFGRSLTKVKSSSVVRFQDLQLVSRVVGDIPNQEERAVSLAHVFERRRAIIDSAIVRLLKKEKEMSVDNIAMQIIKGCGAGKFDQGASFGRFECTFRDVCSRINRLVQDSYVKRDENNQHMLTYIQDPTATSEEGEKETEGGAEPQPSCSEGLKEDVGVATSNSSATHSDGLVTVETKDKLPIEEPEQSEAGHGGPQQICASPSRLHSRKRPGPSKPPMVRLKRKPQMSRMCGGSDLYERDDLPLVTMVTSTNSKGVGDVQVEIDQSLHGISQVLHADVDTVEHLLTFCHWNKDNFIQRYFQDSVSLLKEAGLATGDDGSSSPPDGEPVLCPVCLQSVLREESCWLWCGHACCISCWRHHLLAQIEANIILQSSCPSSGCHARVTRRFFVQLLGEEPEAMKKFNMAVVRSYVEGSGRLTWCRNPQGCDQVLCKGDGIGSGTCQKCQWSSCFSCSHTEAHQPASCSDMTKWVETGGFYEGMGEDAKSKQLANMISKRCPSCNAQIEKNEGCLHMKCKCGHGFCWKCLKPWKPTHSDYYNCLSKIGKAAHDHKKFADVNQRCIAYHRSKAFAEKLGLLVKGITEVVPIRNLTFIMDACRWLFECHKMLGYACVAEYFSQPDASAYLWLLSEQLEGDTNALQALLENTLLSVSDVAHAVRTLAERKLAEGYRLVGKIESTREKMLLGFHQQFKLGEVARLPAPKSEQAESSILVQDPDTDSSRPAFGHLGNLMSQEVSASDHDVPEDEDLSDEGEDDDNDDDNDLEDDDIFSDYDEQFIYDSNEYYDSDYSL